MGLETQTLGFVPSRCISYCSVAVIKYHNQKQLQKEFIWVYNSRDLMTTIVGRHGSQTRKLRDHISTTHQEQVNWKEKHETFT